MPCRGVHFALTDADVQSLRAIDEKKRWEHLVNVIEEDYFSNYQEYLAQSDKSWDAMHRALAGGQMKWDGSEYPLDHVVFGGEFIAPESDYIMSLKSPEQVRDIAAALSAITEAEFRRRYDSINSCDYEEPLSDEDFDYTWSFFPEVRDLYLRAASEGRYVLFTVSF